MSDSPLRVLAIAAAVGDAPTAVAIESVAGWGEALARLAGGESFDVIVVDAAAAPATPARIATVADRVALVVAVADPDSAAAADWLRHGADDVVARAELASPSGCTRLRFAALRRQREARRPAVHMFETTTGLPHRQQLVEQFSQLLALREREPAPMAVLAFRIEGLRPGGTAEAVDVDALRRKIAVRLRAGVRASDVVAAIDDDAFAVLLGSIVARGDGERVALKLVAALIAPYTVGAIERSVAVALGIAHYPSDGNDAERLLRRALSLAAAAPASLPDGPATTRDAAGRRRAAANDDR
ncbi:MAG TPA: GGDEF domain-containing protein [Caldimonas sp.]|nr:GGDEF domain-containing protein [Caldimonas sp.]